MLFASEYRANITNLLEADVDDIAQSSQRLFHKYLDIGEADLSPIGTRLYVVRPGGPGYPLNEWRDGPVVSECRLYNSSYYIEFTFQDGQQTLRLLNDTIVNEVTAVERRVSGTGLISSNIWGYQAVMHSLGYLICGWLETPSAGGILDGPSKVLSTILADSAEFDSYRSSIGVPTIGPTNNGNRTFIYGVEDLVRNITFSMFSQSQLLLAEDGTPEVEIRINQLGSVYRYRPKTLYLGYIISGSITLAGCLLSMLFITITGHSFSNTLSTVIRASRNRDLDNLITGFYTDGSDPLPEKLAETRIKFSPNYSGLVAGDDSWKIEITERWTGNQQNQGARAGWSFPWPWRKSKPQQVGSAGQGGSGDRGNDMNSQGHALQQYPKGSSQASDRPLVQGPERGSVTAS
ncbi:hypothetical protein ABW19_dt0202721 [Dactylella cylindrospora]|nr:hypothetical protein ABW19_dt0202721 [Dactylella cylindrospora]